MPDNISGIDSRIKFINLDSVDSTNTWIKNHPDIEPVTIVSTATQTAGRGQRGNSWEAAPGMNITMSMLWRPRNIIPSKQFAISRAVSLAMVDFLRHNIPSASPDEFTVKWPNDIYYRDLKICGILIEHSISSSSILRTIIGIGLNVNQTVFLSNAPNPGSMATIAGHTYDLTNLLNDLTMRLLDNLEAEDANPGANAKEYFRALYRRDGLHPYATPDGTRFLASIEDVDPTGLLHLRHADSTLSIHPFKSVSFILPD